MHIDELPTRSSLDQYAKQAQSLVEGNRSVDSEWIRYIKGNHPRFRGLSESDVRSATFTFADAQLIIARHNYFETWAELVEYVEAVSREGSPVSQFESAVDAIVTGDVVTLERLLSENPRLIRARSTRRHHATLLHYVGANGTEKQRTPKNAVDVLEILLRAGAEVDAVGEMYGGTTTLGLVATSVHPFLAGLQDELMEVLLNHGASMEVAVAPDYTRGNVVNACLANGRKEAAEFLANRGARLDLGGAAGVGRLDLVESFFEKDGTLKGNATRDQMMDGFEWACLFGRATVVEFLLQKGVEVGTIHHGETSLHWAAYGGHVEIVKSLLARNAPVDVKDESFGATPVGWALHGWSDPPSGANRDHYYEVVALLVGSGAPVDPDWLENEQDRRSDRKPPTDPRMLAALRGEIIS